MKIGKIVYILAILILIAGFVLPVAAEENTTKDAATEYYNKGVFVLGSHEYQRAIDLFDKALASDTTMIRQSDALLYTYQGKSYALIQLNNYSDAIQTVDQGLAIYPRDFMLWNNKGFAFFKLENYPDAIKSYDIALSFDQNYTLALINKGDTLYQMGRFQDAVEAYTKALETEPGNQVATTGLSSAQQAAESAIPEVAPIPDLTLIIVGILLMLCIGGGGYYILHSRKPTDGFTPEILDPVPRTQEPIRGYNRGDLDLTRRKGQQLTLFAKSIEQLCDNAREQYIQGNTAEAERLRVEAEREIDRLKRFEEKIQQWKQAGYETSTLDGLNGQNNLDFIHSRVKDYEDRVSRLEKIGRSLHELNRQYPVEFTNPEIRKEVELFKAQLKNPMRTSDIDGQYTLIRKNIENLSRLNSQWDQRIQSQIQLLRNSIENVKGLGIDTSTFFIKAKSQDSEHSENDLKEMAEAGYSAINNEMNLVQKDGIIVNRSTDEIRTLIDDKNYAGAIIALGKKMSGISASRETYSKAVQLKNRLGPSPVIALFNTGNYEQFLDEGEEILDLINQCTTLTSKSESMGTVPENIPKKFLELSKEQLLNTISTLKQFIQESEEIKHDRLSAHGLFEKAEAFGKIPDDIPQNIDELDKKPLERTISELEKFLKTAKPD